MLALERDRFIVAVDGAAASGKTSLCRALAARLSVPYFNTGLMYRALTLWIIDVGVNPHSESQVSRLVNDVPMLVDLTSGGTLVKLDGKDITQHLRAQAVTELVSTVSRYATIRGVMAERQRDIARMAEAACGGVVCDGRDVTSVVFPDAEAKILLLADQKRRSRRQFGEEQESEEHLRARDAADSQFANFLQTRPDVLAINMDDVDLDAAVDTALGHIRICLATR